MKLTYYLGKLSDLLDWMIIRIVFLGIVGMIVSISLQIVFRVFFNALVWTEEAARYLLVWSTFLGATLAYKRKMHIAVTAGVDLLPKPLRKAVTVLSVLISLLFFGTCAYYGFQLISMQTFQLSPALRLPMRYIYLGIPLSFIVMFVHGANLIAEILFDQGEVEA